MQKRKTTRLQSKKFFSLNEMQDFYDDNEKEIHLYTLNRLQDYWIKNQCVGDVDIYKVDIIESPEVKYMNIMSDEWEEALFNMEMYFVDNSDFEQAAIIRDFSWEVFGKTEIGE